MSFRTWEDEDLNQFAAALYPSTKKRSRRHFSREVLPTMFDEFVAKTKELIGDNFVAITVDGWDHNNQALLK